MKGIIIFMALFFLGGIVFMFGLNLIMHGNSVPDFYYGSGLVGVGIFTVFGFIIETKEYFKKNRAKKTS